MTSARQRRRTGPSLPRAIGVNDNAPAIANDNAPCLIMLGDLPLISRHPIDRLSPGELARVNRIEAALRGRNTREAARLALDYEASQGITPEERCAVMNPANDLDRAVELALGLAVTAYAEAYVPPPPPKKAKRPKGVKKPKEPKPDPLEGLLPGDLTQDEIDRLETADAQMTDASLPVRKAAKATIESIQRAARARAETAAARSAREEAVALERLRGAEIEESDREEHKGRVRILTRDGLEVLSTPRKERKTGRLIPSRLDGIEYAAGLRYRTDHEAIDPEKGLTPPSIDQTRKISRGGDGWAEKLKEIGERIDAIDRMICGVPLDRKEAALPNLPPKHPDRIAMWIIREVAGKGSNLYSLSTSGSVQFRYAEQLKRALGCAAIVYGLE